MKKFILIFICILFSSCGINHAIKKTEKKKHKLTTEILNSFGNVIILDYGKATISNLIYNDYEGNWNLVKIKNGKKNLIRIKKENHFIGDSIVVEAENELKEINTKTKFVLDGTSINFKYKIFKEISEIKFNGEIEDFKNVNFELNYLKIINEIITEEKLNH